jgi:signal transduction histidine kinase
MLSKWKISFYDVATLVNVGISIFLFSMWCFVNFYEYQKQRFTARNIVKGVITFLPIVFYLWMNSPHTGKTLYLIIHTIENMDTSKLLNLALNCIQILNYTILVFYLIYPFLVLRNCYFTTHIKFKKVHAIIFGICLFLMDVFFITMFLIGPFRHLTINNPNLLKFSDTWPEYTQYFYTYMPLVLLFLLETILYFLMKFRLLEQVDIMKKKVIFKNAHLLATDVRPVFHSYKNTLLSIEILEMKVEKEYGSESGLENLREIKRMARSSMEDVGRFLDMFNEMKLTIEAINIVDCVKVALNKISIQGDIKIENKINILEVLVYADKHHIIEMFQNLFLNAVDAIREKNSERGEISVSLECEDDWICIYIDDNGCGIPKKDLKKIFNPLFSTKKTYQNWGIGLSYVYKVVNAHLGFVFVESELGKFTRFQILLPTIRESADYG